MVFPYSCQGLWRHGILEIDLRLAAEAREKAIDARKDAAGPAVSGGEARSATPDVPPSRTPRGEEPAP